MSIQWPLVFFTLLMCAAAGIIGGAGLLVIREKSRSLYLPAIIASAVLIVIGGVSSFLHLQHWERIFNGFGNLTSGITQELVAIVVAVVVLVLFFAQERRTEDGKALPKWIGYVMLVVGIVMALVCAGSYLMPSRPTWANFAEVLYFISSSLLLGSAILWAIAAARGDGVASKLGIATLISGIVSVAAIVIFALVALGAHYTGVQVFYDPVTPTNHVVVGADAVASVLLGSSVALFWGGALVVGAVIPALCGLLSKFKPENGKVLSVVAALCALAGGVCFRAVFYLIGFTVFGLF